MMVFLFCEDVIPCFAPEKILSEARDDIRCAHDRLLSLFIAMTASLLQLKNG